MAGAACDMADAGQDERGLSGEQAAQRLAADGPNALPGGRRRTLLAIAAETVREPMFLLLLAAGTLYLVFGDLQEGLMLFGFVLVMLASRCTRRARPSAPSRRCATSPARARW